MRALLIDAYDSFVYILDQYLNELGVHTDVVRIGEITPAEVDRADPDFLLLGPGPGHPADSGYVELARHCLGRVPMLGVCLGHQALGLLYGATVVRLPRVRHGKSSQLIHDGHGMFAGVPQAVKVTRYHSLIVDGPSLTGPGVLRTAFAQDDGALMALRCQADMVESVQFHPESIDTDCGHAMLVGFLRAHVRRPGAAPSVPPGDLVAVSAGNAVKEDRVNV